MASPALSRHLEGIFTHPDSACALDAGDNLKSFLSIRKGIFVGALLVRARLVPAPSAVPPAPSEQENHDDNYYQCFVIH